MYFLLTQQLIEDGKTFANTVLYLFEQNYFLCQRIILAEQVLVIRKTQET